MATEAAESEQGQSSSSTPRVPVQRSNNQQQSQQQRSSKNPLKFLRKKLRKQGLKKIVSKEGLKAGAKMAARNPSTWPPIAIALAIIVAIFIVGFLICLIIVILGEEDSWADQQGQQGPQLQFTKTVNLVKIPDTTGGSIPNLQYTLNASYPGQADDISITDTIPDNATFVSASGKYTTQKTGTKITQVIWSFKDNGMSLTGSGGNQVIVIDPGHSGKDYCPTAASLSSTCIDTATGLIDHDYPNPNENEEAFFIALKVKAKLQADGYKVILTKGDTLATTATSVTDPIVKQGAQLNATLRERAKVANDNNAALAISIHDDHSQKWGSFAEIFEQKDASSANSAQPNYPYDLHRDTAAGKQVIFSNKAVADLSATYGTAIADARTAAEGHTISITDASFAGKGAGISPGNIPLVQLLANVPWVYNEVGAAPVGKYLTPDQLNKYTQGLIIGIETAVPINKSATSNPNGVFTIVLKPNANLTNVHVVNKASAQVISAGGGNTGGGVAHTYVPPSTSNCNGKYKLNNTIGKNFGDPECNFNKNDLYDMIHAADPARQDLWFFRIVPCESDYNPNAFNPKAVDPNGAWGLFQMGSSGPPAGQAPPSPGRNGPYDRGDVNWLIQSDNATGYAKSKNITNLGDYWSSAKQICNVTGR